MVSVAIWRLCSGPTNDRVSPGLALGPLCPHWPLSPLLHPPARLTTCSSFNCQVMPMAFAFPSGRFCPNITSSGTFCWLLCLRSLCLLTVLCSSCLLPPTVTLGICVFIGLFSVSSPASVLHENCISGAGRSFWETVEAPAYFSWVWCFLKWTPFVETVYLWKTSVCVCVCGLITLTWGRLQLVMCTHLISLLVSMSCHWLGTFSVLGGTLDTCCLKWCQVLGFEETCDLKLICVLRQQAVSQYPWCPGKELFYLEARMMSFFKSGTLVLTFIHYLVSSVGCVWWLYVLNIHSFRMILKKHGDGLVWMSQHSSLAPGCGGICWEAYGSRGNIGVGVPGSCVCSAVHLLGALPGNT